MSTKTPTQEQQARLARLHAAATEALWQALEATQIAETRQALDDAQGASEWRFRASQAYARAQAASAMCGVFVAHHAQSPAEIALKLRALSAESLEPQGLRPPA